MPEERENEWKILEERALRKLSNPESLLDGSNLHLLLRLWQYPAFERHKSWAVYISRTQKNYLIQRIIWNRERDAKKFADPLAGLTQGLEIKPSISASTRSAAADVIEPHIEELFKINVPPIVVENNFELDAIRFGLEFRKFAAEAGFSWRCRAPEEWRKLERWFLKTKNFLDTQFARIK